MNFLKKLAKQRWFSYTVATCAAVVLYLSLAHISVFFGWLSKLFDVLSPVIYGVVIAYVMNPLCSLLEEKVFRERMASEKIAHMAAVASSAVAVLLFIIILFVALVPQVVESVVTLVSNAGMYATEIQKALDSLSVWANERGMDISGLVKAGSDFFTNLLGEIPDQMNNIITASYNVGVGIFNIVISFILAIYFLMDLEHIVDGVAKLFQALLPPKNYRATADFWSECNKILISYITFDLIDGVLVGVANFIYMKICGMPYAVLISVIVGITNLAPTFGPIVGGVIGAVILVLVKPIHALFFVLFTLILQLLDGYVLKPRLFGSGLGVPAVWILVTIIVGGNLFGVAGILLAIPFAAIVTYVYRNMIEMRLNEKREMQAAKEKPREKE